MGGTIPGPTCLILCRNIQLADALEGLGLHRLIIAFFALFSISTLAQEPRRAPAGLGTENLPDAPRSQMASLFSESLAHAGVNDVRPITIAPASLEGSRITLSMLLPLSSKSPAGSSFQARLDQPLSQEGQLLLPQGTIFEGHVQTRPARRMMRPGAMYMAFDRMILPDGVIQKIQLHVVDAQTTSVKADSEGRLHPTVSKKRLAIQLGGTALSAKFADDLAELAGGEAVGAGTARIVGAGAATTFFLLQKGREVKLKSGDKIEVEFDRPAAPSSPGLLPPAR